MSHPAAKAGRVVLGTLLLFAAWALGGYVGDVICPQSGIVGGRESLAAKTGSSVALVIVSLVLGRYVLRSFRLALLCLGSTEVLALLIITGFSGLGMLALSDIQFNLSWLYAVTWNVVLAFLLGGSLGVLWFRRAANNVPEATAG